MSRARFLKIFFSLSAFEGVAVLLWILLTPSMERNARWIGLSSSRLALVILTLVLTLLFGMAVWIGWRKRSWLEKVDRSVSALLENTPLAAWIVPLGGYSVLGLCTVVILGLTLFRQSGEWYVVPARLIQLISLGMSLVERGVPFWVWMILLFVQLTVGSVIYTWNRVGELKPLWIHLSLVVGYWYVSLPLIMLHWVYLVFEIVVFAIIPNWFWKFYDKPLAHPWFLGVVFILGIGGAAVILFSRLRVQFRLILLVALGYCLQVGFGWAEGSGYSTLLQNFLERGHYSYTHLASREPDPWQVVTDYETATGGDSFLLTKPPGVMLVYIVAQKIANLASPQSTVQGKYLALSWFIVWFFPLVASLTPLVVYGTARSLGMDSTKAMIPAVAYLFFPNFLLTPFELDQVLYPLLAAGLIYLETNILTSRGGFFWAVLLGMGLYLACFISFSLLPLAALIISWMIITRLIFFRMQPRTRLLVEITGVATGFLVSYMVTKWGFHYDAISRYLAAVERHRLHKDFLINFDSVMEAAYVNNVEWLLWLGAPFVVLIVFQLLRAGIHMVRTRAGLLDGLAISFGIMFILLNLFGQTRTEVARLWLFLLPPLALFCGSECLALFRGGKRDTLTIFSLQLITTFLIFKLQDLD